MWIDNDPRLSAEDVIVNPNVPILLKEESVPVDGVYKMFQFARDFDLTPQLIARKDIHDIVATVISDGTYVTFPQFVECIGMVAVMAAAKVGCVVGSNELPRMS